MRDDDDTKSEFVRLNKEEEPLMEWCPDTRALQTQHRRQGKVHDDPGQGDDRIQTEKSESCFRPHQDPPRFRVSQETVVSKPATENF